MSAWKSKCGTVNTPKKLARAIVTIGR